MATGTELLKEVLAETGGEVDGLPDNLTSTLLKAIAASIGGSGGAGIQKIEQTTTSTADGGNNVLTITLTDGTTTTFTVKNGSKGSAGSNGTNGKDGASGTNGKDGAAGADGKSAYQYAVDGGYTGTEEEFGVALAQFLNSGAGETE
jgi:hypothetical protein